MKKTLITKFAPFFNGNLVLHQHMMDCFELRMRARVISLTVIVKIRISCLSCLLIETY